MFVRGAVLMLATALLVTACGDDPSAGRDDDRGPGEGDGADGEDRSGSEADAAPSQGTPRRDAALDAKVTPPSSDADARAPGEPAEPADEDASVQPSEPAPSDFKDPGKEPWTRIPAGEVADKCKLDPALLKAADGKINAAYAVIRYGQLCHEYRGGQPASEVYSATKSLGAVVTGVASYETREFKRSGPKTGQLLDTDKASDWLDNISFNKEAHLAHVLGMEAHNRDLTKLTYAYDTIGTTQINRLSDAINAAIKQDATRLGANIEAFTQKFVFEPLGMTSSSWSGGAATKNFAYTWSSTLHDMARLGLLVLHRGMYDGKRVMAADWAYKMTHPSFEAANTAYGYLTWLNARTGGTGPGGAGTGTGGDPCAPAAVWQRYPHGTFSPATDCGYDAPHVCTQMYDVGVWSAQGLGGQFIVGHPGLDLVIVAKNFGGGDGPTGLWRSIRPALVALDPTHKGDEAAFCKAYGGNAYAPDLIGTIEQPAN